MNSSAALREPGAADFFSHLLRRPLIPLVLLAGGAFAALSFWSPPKAPPGPLLAASGRPAVLVGRVAGYPSGRPGGDFFPLRVRWVRLAGAPAFRGRGEVSVFRKKPTEAFAWGDSVSVWGPLVSTEGGPRGPGRALARIFVPEGRSALLGRASPWNPIRWAAALRTRFHESFQRHLPGVLGDLLCGVVLGERPPGLSEFAEDFRRSGTYHLLVASGSNVGFALGVWWIFSRWVLWWPRRWTLVTAPLAAFLYAFMAGGDAPVLRAAVMASAISVGALLGRWDRLEQPLFLSAGILLLWDPSSLFNAGFQMSYAATLAIAMVWRGSEPDTLETRPGPRHGVARVGRWLLDLFVTSLAAQIALAPLLLYYFGRFSWVGLAANMLAVPLAGVCLSLGVGLAFLDGFWPAAAGLWAVPTRWGAESLTA
ncbi:MAG: ComEC/Rec2 family competence protein [Elusimicrobia bacterium]|nr:ComEC/Rec2 family competence protein [Elusimicrobiota bacterium]